MENQKIEAYQSSDVNSTIMPPLQAVRLRLNLALICRDHDITSWVDPSTNFATPLLEKAMCYVTHCGKRHKFIMKWAEMYTDALRHYVASQYTIGFEIHNKAGQLCKPHYHMHFQTFATKEAMRTQLSRIFRPENRPLKCKTDYALCTSDPRATDMEKHFRYPLKMGPIIALCIGFRHTLLEEMSITAAATLKSTRDYLSKKIEKASSPTLCDKLFEHLDKEHGGIALVITDDCVHPSDAIVPVPPATRPMLLASAIRWMDENSNDFTAPSIVSKVNRYMRLRDLMTVDQYVDTLRNIM